VKLWTGAPAVQPTVREKEHALAFRVADKTSISKPVRCTFPYDRDEIMNFGHTLSEHSPEDSAMAEFPAPPWQLRVDIRVKRFRSLWNFSASFKPPEVEVGAEETLVAVWGRIMSSIPNLPSVNEIGLMPRSPSLEMPVTMPNKDVEIAIGATI
jgi:hypothetical protein